MPDPLSATPTAASFVSRLPCSDYITAWHSILLWHSRFLSSRTTAPPFQEWLMQFQLLIDAVPVSVSEASAPSWIFAPSCAGPLAFSLP
eukprot:340523-Pleurochrysis_carterae.AAC.2